MQINGMGLFKKLLLSCQGASSPKTNAEDAEDRITPTPVLQLHRASHTHAASPKVYLPGKGSVPELSQVLANTPRQQLVVCTLMSTPQVAQLSNRTLTSLLPRLCPLQQLQLNSTTPSDKALLAATRSLVKSACQRYWDTHVDACPPDDDASATATEPLPVFLLVEHAGQDAMKLLACSNLTGMAASLRKQVHGLGQHSLTVLKALTSTASWLGVRTADVTQTSDVVLSCEDTIIAWQTPNAKVSLYAGCAYVDLDGTSLTGALLLQPRTATSKPPRQQHSSVAPITTHAADDTTTRAESSLMTGHTDPGSFMPADSFSDAQSVPIHVHSSWQRLMRCMAVLDEVRVSATLMNPSGDVLFQNEASQRYWGRLAPNHNKSVGGGVLPPTHRPARISANNKQSVSQALLATVFSERPLLLDEMLLDVSLNLPWSKVLKVPAYDLYPPDSKQLQSPASRALTGMGCSTLFQVDEGHESQASTTKSSSTLGKGRGQSSGSESLSADSATDTKVAGRSVSFSHQLVHHLGGSKDGPLAPRISHQAVPLKGALKSQESVTKDKAARRASFCVDVSNTIMKTSSTTGGILAAKSHGSALPHEPGHSISMPGTSRHAPQRRSLPQVQCGPLPATSGPLPQIASESLASKPSPCGSMAGSLGLAVEPSSKVLSLLTASSAHQAAGSSQPLPHNSRSSALAWDGADIPYLGTSPPDAFHSSKGPNSAPISRLGPSFCGSAHRLSPGKPGNSNEMLGAKPHMQARAVSSSGPNAIPASWDGRAYAPTLQTLLDTNTTTNRAALEEEEPSEWDGIHSSTGVHYKLLNPATVLVPVQGGMLTAEDLPSTGGFTAPGAAADPDNTPAATELTDSEAGNATAANATAKMKPISCAWHEVEALPLVDPVTHSLQLLLLQTDITGRAQLEASMAALTESQLSMLEQMFPRHVLEFMVGSQASHDLSCLAHNHTGVTILFTDIVGFTTMSKEVPPGAVMSFLCDLFSVFDALVDAYGCYKVETAGDCYIAAGGLMCEDEDGFVALDHACSPTEGAAKILGFAQALIRHASNIRMPHNGKGTVVRVGLHTGPVVTGLIGTKLPKFSLFGDTMNTASRMESTCPHGCLQISAATYDVLEPASRQGFKATGGVEVKGLGVMETYIWDPADNPEPEVIDVAEAGSGSGSQVSAVSATWETARNGASGHVPALGRSSSHRHGVTQLNLGMERSSATTAFRAAAALLNLAAVEAGTQGVGQYRMLAPHGGPATSRDVSDVGSAQSGGRVLLPGQASVGSTHTSRTSRRSARSHASGMSGVSVHSIMSTAARRHPLLGLLRARAATGQHGNVLSTWAGTGWLAGDTGEALDADMECDDQGGGAQLRGPTMSVSYPAAAPILHHRHSAEDVGWAWSAGRHRPGPGT